jgi:proteic killer suppression protein
MAPEDRLQPASCFSNVLPTQHNPPSQSQSITFDVLRNLVVAGGVIVSFRDKRTEDFAEGKRVGAFSGIDRQAQLRLDRLDAATSLRDLAALPGNRLETLKHDRKGQYIIRINDQWRLCFEWPSGSPGPVNVEITDYH